MAKILFLFALVLFVLVPTTLQITPLPWNVTNAMASRSIRYHHFVWHNVRNLWNSLSSTVRAQITSYGWAPQRPAKNANGKPLKDNESGQDFLYFHRVMIANVQNLMNISVGQNISLWNVIPTKNNATYPMPKTYKGPNDNLSRLVTYYKSDAFYNLLKREEKKLTDPTFLRTMTLGQLGTYIEFTSTVHEGLHFRFSSYNKMMRVKSNVAVPFVDPKWDVNTSDWLADIYCSQVNPWFWKIHGWIDNRINDWQKAHGLSNITWNGTWLGGNTSNLPTNLNIPKAANNSRFLGMDDDMSGMNHDMAGMDATPATPATTDSSSDMSGMDMSMGHMGMSAESMNLTTLEAVAKILIETGLSCDYFSDLDNRVAPEHWSDDGDEQCETKKN